MIAVSRFSLSEIIKNLEDIMGNGKKVHKGANIIHITDIKGPNGTGVPEAEESPETGRQEAIEALLNLLEIRGKQPIKINFNLETVSMLYTVVSVGMLALAAQVPENKGLQFAAGGFREAVSNLWVEMGLTPEQCELLNQGIIIFDPR